MDDIGEGDYYAVYVQNYVRPESEQPLINSNAQVAFENPEGHFFNYHIQQASDGDKEDIYWFVACFRGDDRPFQNLVGVNELSANTPDISKCIDLLP